MNINKTSLFKHSLWVLIMLAVFSKVMGFSKPQDQPPLMPRQINLSGNILYFSIPENFSVDFPADDMIESVDLTDKKLFGNPDKFTLIRRWWDIKESGFFAKDIGTIMMSIYIKEKPDRLDKNLLEPLGLIGTIIDDFKKQDETKSNSGTALYPDFYEAYSISTFNKNNWINYPVENPENHTHDIFHAITISDNNYVVVHFSFAPTNSVDVRSFIESYGRGFMEEIMNSFDIKYTGGSQVPAIIKQPVNLQKLIEEKLY